MKINPLFICLLFSTLSHAGGTSGVITGGGGGLTTPRGVEPSRIDEVASSYAGFILKSWFQRLEQEYELLNAESRAASPIRKLFDAQPNIFGKLADTNIEVRSSQPCLDASGQPRDGSIFATHPGNLCLSSFTMASKLTSYNVEAETIALLAHEYSHLVGTDEDEATAIQMRALDDFHRASFADLQAELADVVYGLGYQEAADRPGLLDNLYRFVKDDEAPSTLADLQIVGISIGKAYSRLKSRNGKFSFFPWKLEEGAVPHFALLTIVNSWLSDANKAVKELDLVFGKENHLSAYDFFSRTTTDPLCQAQPDFCYGTAAFRGTVLQRPHSSKDVRGGLKAFLEFNQELQRSALKLLQFRISVYSN